MGRFVDPDVAGSSLNPGCAVAQSIVKGPMKFGVQVDEALKQQPVCITRDPREPRTYELLAAAPRRVQLSA